MSPAKRVAEMSPEEMRRALLVSDKTDLPNRRAFDEGKASPWVAISDVNGLKALNDERLFRRGRNSYDGLLRWSLALV